jgi:hypothetical protein
MDFAGFNLRTWSTRLLKNLTQITVPTPEYTLRAYPTAGYGKFTDHQHTYEILKILEHRSCHQLTKKIRLDPRGTPPF